MQLAIQKKTGTYSETLETVGIGSLLSELGFGNVTIKDQGSQFELSTSGDPEPTLWPEAIAAGYPYIWESSKESKPELGGTILDYEGEKIKRDAARKASKKSKGQLEQLDIEVAPEPAPELTAATMLASMRKGWNADRDLAKWIAANPTVTSSWIQAALGITNVSFPHPPDISNTQILNPIAGNGVNAAKTEARSAGSLPDHLIDPFSEWMKMRGLWEAMLLYRSGEDFKFFVIEPGDISFAHIRAIRTELSKMALWGGIRLDINATLHCARLLLGRLGVGGLGRRTPRKVIRGLRQAYFKSLGTAAALMNDAMLPLPDWFAVHDEDDLECYRQIISEIIDKGGCLNSLDEKHSDDGLILQAFREWLLTGHLSDLLEFHHCFAAHLMQRYASKEWVRPFGTENLSKLLTKSFREKNVIEIIEDAGFQSVARAIRNATIYAVSLPNSKREVRFGLAQKWKQKIKSGDPEFAATLAEFVQDYNWETAHKLKGAGHMVATGELDSLLRLVQSRGAEIVGSLLLAYGFAKAPKVDSAEPDAEAAA